MYFKFTAKVSKILLCICILTFRKAFEDFLYTVAQKRLFIIGGCVKPCIAHIIYRKLLLSSDLPIVIYL